MFNSAIDENLPRRIAKIFAISAMMAFPGPALAEDNDGPSDQYKVCEARHESCMSKCTKAGHAYGDCSKVCAQIWADCNDHGGWSNDEVEQQPKPPKGGHRHPMSTTTKPLNDLLNTPLEPMDNPGPGHRNNNVISPGVFNNGAAQENKFTTPNKFELHLQ